MSLTLKVKFSNGTVRAMRFTPEMSVSEACHQISEKAGEGQGGVDHGLFLPAVEGKFAAKWLRDEKTLQFYDIQTDTLVEYRKKHKVRKVKLLDDTIKTIMLDESTIVSDCVESIAKKMGIKNPEEFSLQRDNGDWLKQTAIVGEIGLGDDEVLVLKKKFFFNDANIDRNDPVQLHLLFVQCRDNVIDCNYPTTKEEARDLAAIQCQVQFGDHTAQRVQSSNWINLKEFLPVQWIKVKGIDKDIGKEYRKLVGMSEVNAKYRYVQLCRSLKTYGMTSFTVKIKDPIKKNKLKDLTLGVTRESVIFMDFETKEVTKSYKLTQIKRWAAADKSFTFDLGDYEPDYITIYTQNSEQIAQLISGYIEIILKTRRETGRVIKDNDNNVANEERVTLQRGSAAHSVTTSNSGSYAGGGGAQYTGYGGQTGSQQVPASSKVAITDLAAAVRATDMLLAELEASGNAPKPNGAVTTLTPQQYRQQLMMNAQQASSIAGSMMQDFKSPPPGGLQALRTQLTSKAQQVMSCLSIVGKNAQNAAYVNEVSDQAMDIMDASNKLASAISKMMKLASNVADGDLNSQEQLRGAAFYASAVGLMMASACEEGTASQASKILLEECAKAVSVCAKLLLTSSEENAPLVDSHLAPDVEAAITASRDASEQLVITTETLAPVAAHAECSKRILDYCNDATKAANAVSASFRKTSLGPDVLNILATRAADLLAAIDLLAKCVECVDPGTVASEGEVEGDLSEEFTAAQNNLTQAYASLRAGSNDPTQLQDAIKGISSSTNRLVACCRGVAAKADGATQNRLLIAAKASLDAVQNLAAACRTALKNPGDAAALEKVFESAGYLQNVNQQMVADAGKIASVSSLCDSAKNMVAMVAALTSSVRASVADMPDTLSAPALKNAKDVSESVPRLIACIKRVTQNPTSDKAQVELLDLAQRTALPPMNLVSAAKRVSPKVSEMNLKQKLLLSADGTAQAVQKLMAACQNFKQIGGHVEIEEALEAFAATIADLETAEIASQGGFLEVLPGQTRENTVELLTLAIKTINAANQELYETAKSNPANLGNAVKHSTNSASQVAVAAKGVASTTPGKAAQKKILSTAKTFSSQMEVLIRSSRTLASNPNDPSADLLMDSSLQDISATLANLIGSSVQIDSRELDEAAGLIHAELSKLGVLNAKNPGANFQTCAEELESGMKALNAAVQQVIGMARNKNLKGLGAAARITAATIPNVVISANNAAAANTSEATQEAIVASAGVLIQNVVGLFDFAKARVINSKDPVYDLNLTQANKNIAEASTKLLRSLGSAVNKDCEEAIDSIMDACTLLDTASLQELAALANSTPDALVQTHQASLQALATAARDLGATSGQIVSSASTSPDQLGDNSKRAAAIILELIQSANRVFCANACQVPHSVFIPAKNILDAGAILVTAGGNIPQIINSARTVSAATQQLLQAAKERAMAIEAPEVQERLLHATQRLATSTSSLAKAAKALAAKQPDGQQLTVAAVKELETATKALLLSASYTAEQGIVPDDFDKLTQSVRNVATSSTTLISSSMSVSSKPKDVQLQGNMGEAAGSLTGAIKDILKASAGMMPGVVECEEAVEISQKASGELTNVALALAVGSFDASIGKGVTLQKTQEDMVEIAKNIGTGILHVARACRQSPEAIGKSAREVAILLPGLVQAAKMAVANTNDEEERNKTVETTKALVDTLLRLAQAATKASGNPSKETYQQVFKFVEESESSINQLVGTLASGVNLLRDIDEAIELITKSSAQLLQTGPVPENMSYQEGKDELNNSTKALALLIKNLVAADKSNLVQVGNAAKEIAKQMPEVIESSRRTMVLAGDEAVKDQIRSAANELVNSTTQIVKSSKTATSEPSNPKHQQEIANYFKSVTASVQQLLAAAKRGAVGEIMSDGAVDQISRAIADLEAFSLFAAAGQLENENGANAAAGAAAQKELFNASKALVVASSQLVGSTKGTQEQLGAAAGGVSTTVLRVIKQTEDVAGTLNEPALQQGVLSACKAVGIATQQLVLAGKDAQRFKKDPTASRSLSKAAEALAEAVGMHINQVHTAYAEAQKGYRELEKTHTSISKMLAEIDSLVGNDDATAVDVATSARSLADASASVVTSANISQDELVKAAIKVSGASAAMLRNTKGAARLLNDDAAKQRLLEKAKNITSAILSLIDSVREQGNDPSKISSAISEASDAVAGGIGELVRLSKTLPGGQTIQLEEAEIEEPQGEDLEEVAERELINAAKQIEAAAAALLAARPAVKPKAPGVLIDQTDIAATIVDASSTIAQAVAKLVTAAAVAQSKRREVRAASGNKYRKDPVWSNGLISAARAVAEATTQLVGSANKAVQGKAEEEELIATARAVAAATAQLVAASRAKSGDDPTGQQTHATLSTAAKAVANATSQLVAAAKAATAFQEQEEDNKQEEEYNFTGSRVKELEQQMNILKLEKQLETARRQMLSARKNQYK